MTFRNQIENILSRAKKWETPLNDQVEAIIQAIERLEDKVHCDVCHQSGGLRQSIREEIES